MPDTSTPYRDRPALDKGPKISWTELESGMLFRPVAGAPSLRRVRGIPSFIWYGDERSPAYLVGSEDEADGRPCGGVIGVADEFYERSYLDDGRPVYLNGSSPLVEDDVTIERLRGEFTEQIAKLRGEDLDDVGRHRLSIAEENLAKLDER